MQIQPRTEYLSLSMAVLKRSPLIVRDSMLATSLSVSHLSPVFCFGVAP